MNAEAEEIPFKGRKNKVATSGSKTDSEVGWNTIVSVSFYTRQFLYSYIIMMTIRGHKFGIACAQQSDKTGFCNKIKPQLANIFEATHAW